MGIRIECILGEAMKAKVKAVRRKASRLHGATASYVSIVDRGANETPFQLIKTAEGIGAMGIKKRKLESKSHKKLDSKQKEAETKTVTKTVMAKMVFDQDVFENEQEVRDWIEKAEWEAESIAIEDDGEGNFVARADETSDESFTKMAEVDTETEGVKAFVGEMIVKSDEEEEPEEEDDEDDDEEDNEDDAEVTQKTEDKPISKKAAFLQKAAEKVKKFDAWDAYYSKENTLAKSLSAGMKYDSTPPGFYDVQAAFNGTVASIFKDEGMDNSTKQEALNKAASDYAEILGGLDNFFDAYIEASETNLSKAFDEDKKEYLKKWADEYAEFVTNDSVQSTASTEKKETAAKPEEKQVDVSALLEKALEPITKRLNEVSITVQKVANRRQTSKAVDLTEGNQDTQKKTETQETDDWLLKKQRKSLIGG